MKCTWFNATYLRDRFKPGQMVALYGKVEEDRYGGQLQLMQPQFEILGESSEEDGGEQKTASSLEVGRIVPIYESAGQGRVTPRWFRRIIHAVLENLPPELTGPRSGHCAWTDEPDCSAGSVVARALARSR